MTCNSEIGNKNVVISQSSVDNFPGPVLSLVK